MSRALPHSVASLLVLAAQWSLAQAPGGGSPDATHDLRISDQARAVVVEAHQHAEGEVVIRNGAAEMTHAVDFESDARWLDEVGAPGGPAVHHKRTYLRYQVLDDGRVRDPGLDGLCVTFAVVGDQATCEARAPRQILKSQLKRLSSSAGAVGLYVKLPGDAVVGGPVAFPAETLIATVLNVEDAIRDLKTDVKLVRVDEETGRAHLAGTVSFSARFDKGPLSGVSTYEATVTAEIDLEAHVLSVLTMSGTSGMKGRGKSVGKISGDVAFSCEARAKVVTDPGSYRVKKPVFRENTHAFSGASFKLPSCWIGIPQSEPGIKQFVDSRCESGAAIEIAVSDAEVDPSSDAFIEGFLAVARKEAPDIKVKKATFPIGRGITFELTADTRQRVRGFVAPVGSSIVRVRLVGTPDQVKRSDAELRRIQETLLPAE
jgi:hypothetical protein